MAERPAPGAPRSYEFPPVTRRQLPNGLQILIVDLPGRPLVSASMVVVGGAAEEPADQAGATVLAARALTEGTERYEAIALVEASERLGASLHAESGWDALSVSVDVPADRLAAALDLVAEVLLHPTFPGPEVERLRDERLNDLLQAQADPRRRVEEAFVGTIYASSSPYHRPSGGTRETVEGLASDQLRAVYGRMLHPARATLIVGGDLGGQDVVGHGRAPVRRVGRLRSDRGRDRDHRRHGHVGRAPRPGHPSAGLGPDRDPRRPSRLSRAGSRTSMPCR